MSNFNHEQTLKAAGNRSKYISIADRKDELETIATEWQNRKNGTKGLTPLGGQKNSFVVGLLGELIYARFCGQEDKLNLDYKPFGDGGVDFFRSNTITVDVKTCSAGRSRLIENKTIDPGLKSFKHPNNWAKYFVLVELNPEQTGGWVLGWTTKERLLNGNVIELFPGEGERYVMDASELFGYDTEINYIFHMKEKGKLTEDVDLAEWMRLKRENDYRQYHEAYQQQLREKMA